MPDSRHFDNPVGFRPRPPLAPPPVPPLPLSTSALPPVPPPRSPLPPRLSAARKVSDQRVSLPLLTGLATLQLAQRDTT